MSRQRVELSSLTLALLMIGLGLVGLTPQAVGHDTGPYDATFDPQAGNEWWVEVYVSGTHEPAHVEARAGDGPWHELTKRSWGAWAASFHVPDGSVVEFRAEDGHGGSDTSSGYVWPTAEPVRDEDRGGASGDFTASFDPEPGNEWWVEVFVTASDPLTGVDTRADGGAWVALEKQGWGAWAKSFHVPDGSHVEFRATSEAGDQIVSDAYVWPSAEKVSDDGTGTTDPDAGDTRSELTFDHLGGNEWWVEAHIEGSYSIYVVHAEESDGNTIRLQENEWGNWVGSMHIEPDDEVRFFVNDRDGTPAQVSCWFTHPEGVTPDGGKTCAGTAHDPDDGSGDGADDGTSDGTGDVEPSFVAAVGPKAGNEWWVETIAIAELNITSVEARADGGSWHLLEKTSWGSYAKSFHAPDGAVVEFRVATANGTWTSDGFVWPQATWVDSDGSWPEEGSYVDWQVDGGVGGWWAVDVDAKMVYQDGRWWVECRGEEYYEPVYEFGPSNGPGYGDPNTQIGDVETVGQNACSDGGRTLTVQKTVMFETRKDGDRALIETWYAEWVNDSCDGCDYAYAIWDKETGMTLDYWDGGTGFGGAVVQDTNAPIG